jgi:hypothetical protein
LIKQRFRYAGHFVLLTIFLMVQWMSPHAHLSGTHEHSGDRHHHAAEIHAHQPIAQHPDAIDVGHATHADTWEIEYTHPQLPLGGQQPDTDPVALPTRPHIPFQTASGQFRFPENSNHLPDLLPAHIGQPRAPPRLA